MDMLVLYLEPEDSEAWYLGSLGIKVIIAGNCNVEAMRQGFGQCLWTVVFPSKP